MKKDISFSLNGRPITVNVSPDIPALKLLREHLSLTGTKEGCGVGECGACTIIVNKRAVNSCLLTSGQLEGCQVITIEGLSRDGELDKLQKAFLQEHAVQCGFCTPGMIMSAKALLLNNPTPSKEEIKTAMSGNLCRCTGYQNIINAVQRAASD